MSNSSSLHINEKMDNTSSHDFITPVKMMQNRPDTQRAIEENNNVCVSMPEHSNGKRNDEIASNVKYKGNRTDLNDKSFHSFRQNAKSKSVFKSSKMNNNNSSGMKINERYNVNSSIDLNQEKVHNIINSKLVNNSCTFSVRNKYYDYLDEKDQRMKYGESKIVRRFNKKDYDNSITYGKPSNVYANEHFSLSDSYYGDNKRTFKKFSRTQYTPQKGNQCDIYSCDNCKEFYKMLIDNKKDLKPMKCVQCGNIMNEQSYQFYCKQFSGNKKEENGKNRVSRSIEDGKISVDWKKWNDMRAQQNKENLAYDIITGRAKVDLSKSNDNLLKQMVSSTREKLNRSSTKKKK